MRNKMQNIALISLSLAVLLLGGCVSQQLETSKQGDLTFIQLEESQIPTELMMRIEQNKHRPFRLTYADQGEMYLARGYGSREKSGYEVNVTELYETENTIYLHTILMGPKKGENSEFVTVYPFVVVKLPYQDKIIEFR